MTDDRPFGDDDDREPLYTGEHDGIPWMIYGAPSNQALNGYARIPDGYTINTDHLEVHGGITYGYTNDHDDPDSWAEYGTGWVGFDTSHFGDVWDKDELTLAVGHLAVKRGEAAHAAFASTYLSALLEALAPATDDHTGTTWTIERLMAECEKLAGQIAEYVKAHPL
jgi:hypothetical protein